MAMEKVLEQLEGRINDLVTAYSGAKERISELESRVKELENEATASQESADRITQLEQQRETLATRLEKVLSNIDEALKTAE